MLESTEIKTFKSEFDAWKWVHDRFPGTQWYLDHESSERAGYKIYRDIEEFYNYICELSDRLEVNLKEGNRTINLWIEEKEPEKEPEIKPEIKPETHKIEFTEVELILIKCALYKLSTSFNELDIVKGNSDTLDASINCLELIKRINGVNVKESEAQGNDK